MTNKAVYNRLTNQSANTQQAAEVYSKCLYKYNQ